MTRRVVLLTVLLLAGVASADAQSPSRSASLSSTTCPGTGCVVLGVQGLTAVGAQITGTWTATIAFEGSIDGATYTALNMTPTDSGTAVTSTTANGIWMGNCGGLSMVRARVTAFTSGTALVTLQAAPVPVQ